MILSEAQTGAGRPQPKPRLSLLLTSKDFPHPNYENLHHGSLCFDGQQQFVKKWSKPKPRPRSTLDLPLHELPPSKTDNLLITHEADSVGKVCTPQLGTCSIDQLADNSLKSDCSDIQYKCNLSAVTEPSNVYGAVGEQFNCTSEISVNADSIEASNGIDGVCETSDTFRPLKCMPYNSPELPKCVFVSAQKDFVARKFGKRFLNSRMAVAKMSSVELGSRMKSGDALRGKALHSSIPARCERGAVSTKQLRKTSFKRLDEGGTAKDSSDSSDCSNASGRSSPSSLTRRKSGTTSKQNNSEHRRSTAVPPQMVANLTHKFNAIISQNQNVGVVSKKPMKLLSSIPKSCPSSPLRNMSSKMSCTSQMKMELNMDERRLSKSFIRGSMSRSSCPDRKKEKDAIVERKSRVPLLSDNKGSDSDSSITSGNNPSYVKRAVLNYEVTISSTTSSPELERKNSFTKTRLHSPSNSPLSLRRMGHSTSAEDNKPKSATGSPQLNYSRTSGRETNLSQVVSKLTKTENKTKELLYKESSTSESTTKSVDRTVRSHLSANRAGTVTSSASSTSYTMTTSRILNIRRNIQPATYSSHSSEDEDYQDSKVVEEISKDEGNVKNTNSDVVVNKSRNETDLSRKSAEEPMSAICKARMILERRNKTVGSISNEDLEQAKNYNKQKDTVPPPLPTTNPRIIPKYRSMRSTSNLIQKNNNTKDAETNKQSFFLHSKAAKCEDTNKLNESERNGEVTEKRDIKRTLAKDSANNTINSRLIAADAKQQTAKSLMSGAACNEPVVYSLSHKDKEKSTKNSATNEILLQMKSSKTEIVQNLEINQSNYVPNTSFLWRETKLHQINVVLNTAIPPPPVTAPPPVPRNNSDFVHISDEKNNLYDKVVSPTNYEEPVYSEAINLMMNNEHSTSEEEEEESIYESAQNLGIKHMAKTKVASKEDVGTQNDSDEGWEDVSDTEIEMGSYKHSSLPIQSRVRNHNRKFSCKRSYRRSWSQGIKEFAANDDDAILEDQENERNGCSQKLQGEESCDSDDSDSTDPNHHYEALYEVITQARHGRVNNFPPESYQHLKSEMQSSESIDADCILEESPEDLNDCDTIGSELQTLDNNLGEKRKLKRNWSLTKSDIRLELTSRLNRIRVKKTSTSASDVHIDFTENQNGESKKKPWSLKTKFTRKKSTTSLPSPKQSPSPRKESALFYVDDFVQQCNGDANEYDTKDGMMDRHKENSEKLEKTNSVDEGSNTALHRTASHSSKDGNRYARQSGSRINIVRPKTPPPPPPANHPRLKNTNKAEEMSDENVQRHEKNSEADSSSIKQADSDTRRFGTVNLSRSNSTISTESEFTCVPKSPKTRSSFASSTGSTNSSDSYIQMQDINIDQRLSELDLDSVQRRYHAELPERPDSFEERLKTLQEDLFLDPGIKTNFEDEPLYQFYNVDAQKRATQMNMLDEEEEYDEEALYESIPNAESETLESKHKAMELINPTSSGQRTLWSELQEVRDSGILDTITTEERNLQEAMFEVITSEASYLKSLNVLTSHFMRCREFIGDYSIDCVLTKRQYILLFSDVAPVKEVSEKLLVDLEQRWQENIMISGICDIIHKHAVQNFGVYKKYCKNQIYQERMLADLKDNNPQFIEVLRRLEGDSKCHSLTMHSFLMLPMQRITRLPLLLDAISTRLKPESIQYNQCQLALNAVKKIVHDCNEAANQMQQMEEMITINNSLLFREVKHFPLISNTRRLLKKGSVNRLVFTDSTKLSFRRCHKKSLYLYLFTDLLMLTKKKGEQSYLVLDYCPRNMIRVAEIDGTTSLPIRPPEGIKNLFQLTLLQNHENKTIEMFVNCPTESDLTRWMNAFTPPTSDNPDERIYEQWDCPQVQAIHQYTAQEPDELSLEIADVVNVLKKVSDGWYHGERITDGVQGWFPANHTREIQNAHVRARNLHQRYRLLQCAQQQQIAVQK